jgi:glycerol kinase
MGDSQASLFAQRCFQPGMAKTTLGTGCSILLNIGSDLRLTDGGAVSTIAWIHRGVPTYALEGIINYSAATVSWLQNQLELIDDPLETEKLAVEAGDNGGVYLVPAFAGLSAPYWSQTARAAILGMTAHTNRKHVVRAALESIAYQIRDVLDMMKDATGLSLQSVHADGGATANRFLMQFIADMIGLELRVSDTPELSPLGAALSGSLGMGVHASLDELASLPGEFTAYARAMDARQVEEHYSGWKQAVARVL